MIIWANRMYPKRRIFVMGGKVPAMPGVLPETASAPLRPEYERDSHAVYAPYFAGETQNKREVYAPFFAGNTAIQSEHRSEVYAPYITGGTQQNSTVSNTSHFSEVYAPRTVGGNTATHNSRVSTAYGDTENVQNVTYHTAVQVEMKNYNQIHGEQDMVRLAETLSDALYAALQSGGEGVGH